MFSTDVLATCHIKKIVQCLSSIVAWLEGFQSIPRDAFACRRGLGKQGLVRKLQDMEEKRSLPVRHHGNTHARVAFPHCSVAPRQDHVRPHKSLLLLMSVPVLFLACNAWADLSRVFHSFLVRISSRNKFLDKDTHLQEPHHETTHVAHDMEHDSESESTSEWLVLWQNLWEREFGEKADFGHAYSRGRTEPSHDSQGRAIDLFHHVCYLHGTVSEAKGIYILNVSS